MKLNTNKQTTGLNRLNLLWGLAVVGYVLIHMFIIPRSWGRWSLGDSGLFSILTICLVTAGLSLLIAKTVRAKQFSVRCALIALSYVSLIYIFREADLHRLLTAEHVTKIKFYTDPTISLFQRSIFGVIMVLFIASLMLLFFRYGLVFMRHLLSAQPWTIAAILWACFLITSQVVDKAGLSETYLWLVAEEMLEFCASGYFFLAVYVSRKSFNTT